MQLEAVLLKCLECALVALFNGSLCVAGGGVALLQAASALDAMDNLTGDEATGVKIVREALSAPLKQIAHNAGLEPGV